ncbi:unnamed protein product [Moneuplotes crassus]|uniref:Uncharacterized protein n=1 Tax=Euplotes crassus TaxID=5936 RepID=A0AAD1Y499_EUPCR|nr:unnamed protein product [Moneuplotes crassus]
MKFEPRKFSFDPKDKKLYLSSKNSPEPASKPKFFCEGKLVASDDTSSAYSPGCFSEGSSPLAYLKSVIDSEQDSYAEEVSLDIDEVNSKSARNDEEMAVEVSCDSKMGPIFALFQQE